MLASALAVTLAVTPLVTPAENVTWHTLDIGGAAPLDYALVLPEAFDPDTPHPVLVALPPGGGGRDMVARGLELYFTTEARRRGWVVVSPAAPEGTALHESAETWMPALLDQVSTELAVEGGTFHLAGVSNGGRGAFHVAGLMPGRFASMTVLPGVPVDETDPTHRMSVATLPIWMSVGETDTEWVDASRAALDSLLALGAARVSLDVMPGEGHVLDAAIAPGLFDRLDALRDENRQRAAAVAQVAAVLDDLHEAAAVADEERYFAHYLPEAIFIGTDATERWTVAQLRAYAAEPFTRESAWTYTPIERHVEIGPEGTMARFDERLMNQKYGETRGSGVLRLREGRWRIEQYVLSFAVPNEVAPAVVQVIAEGG